MTRFTVLAHPDARRLVRELAQRLGALAERAPVPEPVLVLAPTHRQVLFLREALARERGALLGVEVLHHQALAYRLARQGERPAPALASKALLDALVLRAVRRHPDLDLVRYVASHPTVLFHVVSTIKELREAGVAPEALRETGSDLAPILADVASALLRLEDAAGLTDRAGLVRRAVEAAPRAPRYRAVFHYGAYDLVGMNLELLHGIPVEDPIVFLVPADLRAASGAYARRFVETHLGPFTMLPPEAPPPRDLFAPPPPALSAVHCQGPEAELTFAAREALRLLAAGAAPRDIAVVARTLEPYAGLAETVFARHGLPVDSSAPLPLDGYARPRAFLLLLRVLAEDFRRQDVVDLLRSPGLRVPEGARDDGGWQPDSWDRWSRSFAVLGGAEAWARDLPEALTARERPHPDDPDAAAREAERRERRRASALTLTRLIEAWSTERAAWARCRAGAEHAAFLRGLGERWIYDWDGARHREGARSGAVTAALLATLDDLARLDDVVRAASGEADHVLDAREAADFVESSLSSARLPWTHDDGVAFLDVMQARGLVFRHLVWIGFNDDLVPRHPRESLLLRDDARRALSRPGRPVAVRLDARDEEDLLLAQTLEAATESRTLVWQRADADGKEKAPSLDLRRLQAGLPDGMPAHPARAASWLAARSGLLTLEEGALLAAEGGSPGPAVGAFLEAADPGLAAAAAPGLHLAQATDAFQGGDLAFDAFTPGPEEAPFPFSPTSLQELGRCPQAFFFRRRLGVVPLDDEAEAFSLDAREMGNHFHRLLHRIFEDLRAEGRLDGSGRFPDLQEAARRALDRHWPETWRDAAGRLAGRAPLLHQGLEALWRGEIQAFLDKDLARWADRGLRLLHAEEAWQVDLRIPQGAAALRRFAPESVPGVPDEVTIPVRGIPDRVAQDREGRVLVSDYKTAGGIHNWINPKDMLIGARFQVPVYGLLAAQVLGNGNITTELIGLGPYFFPDKGFTHADPPALEPDTLGELRPGIEETLLVFANLARAGRFPMNPADEHHCLNYCRYRSACRRLHYASRERVRGHEEFALYFENREKSTKRLTLDAGKPRRGKTPPGDVTPR